MQEARNTYSESKKMSAAPALFIPQNVETRTITLVAESSEKPNEFAHDDDDKEFYSHGLLELIATEHGYLNRHRSVRSGPSTPKSNTRFEMGNIWTKIKTFAFRNETVNPADYMLSPVSHHSYSTRQTSEAGSAVTTIRSPTKEVVKSSYVNVEVERSSVQTSGSPLKKIPEWSKQVLLKEAEVEARPADHEDYCGLFLHNKGELPQAA